VRSVGADGFGIELARCPAGRKRGASPEQLPGVCAAVRRALHHVRGACGTRRHRGFDGQRHLERHAGEAGADDTEQFRPVGERHAHLAGERDGVGSKPAHGDEDGACGRARALHAVQLAHQRDADTSRRQCFTCATVVSPFRTSTRSTPPSTRPQPPTSLTLYLWRRKASATTSSNCCQLSAARSLSARWWRSWRARAMPSTSATTTTMVLAATQTSSMSCSGIAAHHGRVAELPRDVDLTMRIDPVGIRCTAPRDDQYERAMHPHAVLAARCDAPRKNGLLTGHGSSWRWGLAWTTPICLMEAANGQYGTGSAAAVCLGTERP
jgi:hypothetical protein